MHIDTLSEDTKIALEKVAPLPFLKRFYLAGGTALALHYGHRESVDLDFFTTEELPREHAKKQLAEVGRYEIDTETTETVDGSLDGVRVSLFYHPYELLYPTQEYAGVAIADERDIAAMKVNAIANRGTKKDFVDFYFLLQKYTADEILGLFKTRYSSTNFNEAHIYKSITYFAPADAEPMPQLTEPESWEHIKKAIMDAADKMVR